MTSVLGLPLEKAVGVLTEQGARVELREVKSRRGSTGEARVIRQSVQENGSVLLCWSNFKTLTDS